MTRKSSPFSEPHRVNATEIPFFSKCNRHGLEDACNDSERERAPKGESRNHPRFRLEVFLGSPGRKNNRHSGIFQKKQAENRTKEIFRKTNTEENHKSKKIQFSFPDMRKMWS